jgi:hypothetical protein
MSMRTITKTVKFRRPFSMRGVDGTYPAGTYVVETDEVLIEPLSFTAYQRIATTIQLPQRSGRAGWVETHVIDPEALAASLARDALNE